MITAKEISKQQTIINEEIEIIAKKQGFFDKPIYDGVCSIDHYIKSNPKVMWILKEPWEENEEGKEGKQRGGWSITDDCFWEGGVWDNPAWRKIMFVMYCYLYGLDDMNDAWRRRDERMIDTLRSIAYINISKMPGGKKSNYNNICKYYKTWKQIIYKQIDLYSPEVIVFGGTYSFFKDDLEQNGANYKGYVKDAVYWYEMGNRKLIDAYHPSAPVKRDLYVNSIVGLLNEWYPR